ncbi:MAG: hypothetical protein A3F72_09560 [Bacteroidetes bacterium RIFCSPLOWO2_12_FULL_35_15]|nr:MAG: hypothetical protein A3F72_09560 [Bacteroidetes bacterium RIFCSPLOWO2_12_FULL_35_15]
MKKIIIVSLLLSISSFAFAKKVKFAVDMTGIPVSSLGMHVSGDFQTLAGFAGGDWAPNTTSLVRETADTNIFSIVVNIPAFAKYEYKFVNGDQFYEAEFVPVEARVGYNFNDNRWLYVDSLANDTTFVGAIRFAGNAPAGFNLIRFKVDMLYQTVSAEKPHVAGTWQGWNTAKNILYSFNDTVYEYIAYIDTNAAGCQFKYINGNLISEYETVPASCATSGNRNFLVPHDTVLEVVCFSTCYSCSAIAGISEHTEMNELKLFPNPATDFTILHFNDIDILHSVYILDITGRIVRSYNNHNAAELRIEKETLTSGVYFLTILNSKKNSTNLKLIIE